MKDIKSFKAIIHAKIQLLLTTQSQYLFLLNSTFLSPFHVIFPQIYLENIKAYQNVLLKHEVKSEILFAMKSNKAESLIEANALINKGVEVSSINELKIALNHGIIGSNIVVSGPNKTKQLLLLACKHNCLISVDSEKEISKLSKIVTDFINKTIKVLLRVNDEDIHLSRFGIPINNIFPIINKYNKSLEINICGISFHLNNYNISSRVVLLEKCFELIDDCKKIGVNIRYIDIGGGFPINYLNRDSWDPEVIIQEVDFYNNKKVTNFYPYHITEVKEQVLDKLLSTKLQKEKITISEFIRKNDLCLILEPGRSLLDQAGITVMEVGEIKKLSNGQNMVMVHGNINHLSEQWFGSEFLVDPILITKKKKLKKNYSAYIGGNMCLESDLLAARKVNFEFKPQKGDLLVFINTAGYQMDSNESEFQRIPLPNKITMIVKKNKWNYYLDQNFSCMEL